VTFGHCEVARFNTTTTSARLLLHNLVSSAMPARENQRQNFLFENMRKSQQKKKDPDLDQLQSRSLFSSVKSRASTPPPPPPPGFCFTIWFPQQRQREKTRDRTSCLKT
jgi:hypothetical protein